MESLGLLLAEFWYKDLRKRVSALKRKEIDTKIAKFVHPNTELDRAIKDIQRKHTG